MHFDRLENRHVVILNPSSVEGIKETVMEGTTPEIMLKQGRTLLASIQVAEAVDDGQRGSVGTPLQ